MSWRFMKLQAVLIYGQGLLVWHSLIFRNTNNILEVYKFFTL